MTLSHIHYRILSRLRADAWRNPKLVGALERSCFQDMVEYKLVTHVYRTSDYEHLAKLTEAGEQIMEARG